MIENAASDQSGGVLATLMGIAALIFAASGAFVEPQDAPGAEVAITVAALPAQFATSEP
jgi:hypothetical protein